MVTCSTCNKFRADIARAVMGGDVEKVRVLSKLHASHMQHTCPNRARSLSVVAVDEHRVVWGNGVEWIVRD